MATYEPLTEQQIREQYPFGTVNCQIDDLVRPLTLEEYEEWVAEFAAKELDADIHIGRGETLEGQE